MPLMSVVRIGVSIVFLCLIFLPIVENLAVEQYPPQKNKRIVYGSESNLTPFFFLNARDEPDGFNPKCPLENLPRI